MSNADRQITVFSNEGRLYQVEYSFTAVKNSGFTTVGVRGKDSVYVITQKKLSDKSVVPSSVTHIFKVTDKIGVIFTGLMPDAKTLLVIMRQKAAEFQDDFGYTIPINVLAQKISEQCQFYTQQAHMRPLCVISLLFSFDDEKGPQLIKLDPAGFFLGYFACATGEKEQSTVNYLEREFKKKSSLSDEETIQLAIKSLQNSLNTDFRKDDIEIGVVKKDQLPRTLSSDEVEKILNVIGESD